MPDFDPYHRWLAIPPHEQPPNHYRLLNIALFEADPEVIEAAADQRMAYLRTHQTGPHGGLSQKLLNEVAMAKLCLLNKSKKPAYDAALREAAADEPDYLGADSGRVDANVFAGVAEAAVAPDPLRARASPAVAPAGSSTHKSPAVPRPVAMLLGAIAGVIFVAVLLKLFSTMGPRPPVVATKTTSETKTKVIVDPPTPLKQPVDLLALIDPAQHTVAGQWQREGGGLESSISRPSLLRVPYLPPAEYDLTLAVERVQGSDCFVVGLVAGGRNCQVVLDSGTFSRGLELLDGVRIFENPTRNIGQVLFEGQPAVLTVRVRRDGLRVEKDGQAIIEWKGDYRQCSSWREWSLPGTPSLGLGAWDSAFRITRFQVLPVSDDAQVVPGILEPPVQSPKAFEPLGVGSNADLVPFVDVERAAVRGRWQREGNAIACLPSCQHEEPARLMLPAVIHGDYDMEIEFTRHAGNEPIVVLLPIAERLAGLTLQGEGKPAGLSFVWYNGPDKNLTCKEPRPVINGQRHKVALSVRLTDRQASIGSRLDDRPMVDWSGPQEALGVSESWTLLELNRPGVGAAQSAVTFHAVRITPRSPGTYLVDADQLDKEPCWLSGKMGGDGGRGFRDLAPNGGVLAGFRLTSRKWDNEVDTLSSVQPIYRIEYRTEFGTQYGSPNPTTATLLAPAGYAVAEVHARADDVVRGMRLVYCRLRNGRLDRSDVATSDWFGGNTGQKCMFKSPDDRPIPGVFGSVWSAVDSLGLILTKPSEQGSPGTVRLVDLRPSFAEVGYASFRRNHDEAAAAWPVFDRRLCDEFVFAHAQSHLVYPVPEGAERFSATGYCRLRNGEVRFRVFADEKLLWQSEPAGLAKCSVELPKGARRLHLLVDPMSEGAYDHSSWCQARFEGAGLKPVLPRPLPMPVQ